MSFISHLHFISGIVILLKLSYFFFYTFLVELSGIKVKCNFETKINLFLLNLVSRFGLKNSDTRRIGTLALGSLEQSLIDWIGLDWIGLDWIGLDWIGLDLNSSRLNYWPLNMKNKFSGYSRTFLKTCYQALLAGHYELHPLGPSHTFS